MTSLLVLFGAVVMFGMVNDVSGSCTPSTEPGTKLNLNIPDEFSVDVEIVEKVKKTVDHMKMYYSKQRGQISITHTRPNKQEKIFFYLNQNEVLTFDMSVGRGKCTVTRPLNTRINDFLFGGVHGDTSPMAAVFFMGKSLFPFPTPHRKQLQNTKIRGKDCLSYQSCIAWTSDVSDIILEVVQNFAISDFVFPWERSYDISHNPGNLLQSTIKGTGMVHGNPNTQIDQVYSFYNLKTGFSSLTVFETPAGVVCDGRDPGNKKMPSYPPHIKFTSEGIAQTGEIYTVQESYDFDRSLAILWQNYPGKKGIEINRISSILDFKSGKAYRYDSHLRACRQHNITDLGQLSMFYSISSDGKVNMDNPRQFFRAEGKDFSYLGQKTVRGLMTDVFVAESKDFKDSPDAIVEWYFAPPLSSWNDDNPGYVKNKWPYPVKYRFWRNKTATEGFTSNIYHVDYSALRPDAIDLSSCFKYKQHFQMVLLGNALAVSNTVLEEFKAEVAHQVSNATQISLIQINEIQVFYENKNDVVIEFFIVSDHPLDAVSDKLTNAIHNNALTLKVNDPLTNRRDIAVPVDTIASVFVDKNIDIPDIDDVSDGDGYSPGAMGGLGVAMIAAGLGGGIGAGFLSAKFL